MEGLVKEGSLGSILFKSNIITEEDIRRALAEQQRSGCRIGEALISLGIVTQEDIDWALSNQLDIPYVRLKKDMIDRDAVALLPAEVARRFNLIPVIRAGDELTLAMADPLNREAIAAVEKSTGCRTSVSIALIREIREMLEIFYGPEAVRESLGFSASTFSPTVLDTINADLSGGKLLDYLLLHCIREKIASLSLEPLGDKVRILAKRGGVTGEIGRLAISRYPDLLLRIRRLSRINGSEEIAAQGTLQFVFKGQRIPFQVHLLRARGGDYITIRPQFASRFPSSLANAGIDPAGMAELRKLLATQQGMIFVADADTAERSQFMDLILAECETGSKRVLMIGDSLGRDKRKFPCIPSPLTGNGLGSRVVNAALDHDPDILVIEDISESQTFVAATRAAMRGKLVVAGLPLEGTERTLRHLLSYRHKHYWAPEYLRGIITLKGVLTLCPHCRKAVTPSADYLATMNVPQAQAYYRPTGCPACGETGYKGYRYLLEVITADDELRKGLSTAVEAKELLALVHQKGVVGISDAGRNLLMAGEISPEEFAASILL